MSKIYLIILNFIIISISLPARYYNPDLGRFITADSITPFDGNDLQGLNRYSYCLNNPIKYIDPSGNEPIKTFFNDTIIPWLEQDTNYAEHVAYNTRVAISSGLAYSSIKSIGLFATYKAWNIQKEVYKKYPEFSTNYDVFSRHYMFGFLTAKELGNNKAAILNKLIPVYQYKYAKGNKKVNENYDTAGKLYYDIGMYLYNHFKNSNVEDAVNLALNMRLFFNTADMTMINLQLECMDKCKDLITFDYFDKKTGNLLPGNLIIDLFQFGANGMMSVDSINKFINIADKMGWSAKYTNEIYNKYKDVIISGSYSDKNLKDRKPENIFKK